MAVADSIESGRVATLRALLVSITDLYDKTENPRDAKALAVEMREIMAELDELDPKPVEKQKTALDELRARREARKAG
jgi:hypothetical protein